MPYKMIAEKRLLTSEFQTLLSKNRLEVSKLRSTVENSRELLAAIRATMDRAAATKKPAGVRAAQS
jgi:hypothetical protein